MLKTTCFQPNDQFHYCWEMSWKLGEVRGKGGGKVWVKGKWKGVLGGELEGK